MTMNTITRGLALVAERLPAFIAGSIFVAGAGAILFEDVVMHAAPVETKHVLALVVFSGTLLVGHVATQAWLGCHWLRSIGFALLFATGTALVTYKSTGRQAEHTFASEADAGHLAKALADKGAELEGARQRKADADKEVDHELKGRPNAKGVPTVKPGCGKNCEDWKKRATEVQAHIEKLEREIAELGPQKPAEPEAENFANIAAVFGADKAKVKAAAVLVVPFIQTVLFELGGIWCLGFAFRHPRVETRATVAQRAPLSPTEQSDFGGIDTDLARQLGIGGAPGTGNWGNWGNGGTKPAPKPGNGGNGGGKRVYSKTEALFDLQRRLRSGETVAAQDELAAAWGVDKSTVSKWLRVWREKQIIPAAQRVGRCHRLVAAS